MNADLAKQRLERDFLALTGRFRLLRECRYLLNEECTRALEERVALAAARRASEPVLDRERLRTARTASAVALVSLVAAGALTSYLLLSSGG